MFFFFSSRRRHTRSDRDWSSDVCSSDLANGRDLFRGIRHRADNLLVGLVGSHDRGTGTVEIGYWIGTAFQRRGYAPEAVRGVIGWLGAQTPPPRIVAECRPENRASWRVLELLGFRPTGAAGTRPGRVELELPR